MKSSAPFTSADSRRAELQHIFWEQRAFDAMSSQGDYVVTFISLPPLGINESPDTVINLSDWPRVEFELRFVWLGNEEYAYVRSDDLVIVDPFPYQGVEFLSGMPRR